MTELPIVLPRITAARWIAASLLAMAMTPLTAAQVDLQGPVGSARFGRRVAALPNGNIVVVDSEIQSNTGAVYLYSANGVLISTLTGSTPDDSIGDGGIVVVGNSNFLVISGNWNNGAATAAGAVTWVNGTTGLNGAVSAGN